MAAPLLHSKVRVPGRPLAAMARPRLTDRLGGALHSALTVLSAPAGFGKTTLLTEWLTGVPADRAAVAWLSLDDGDNDPALFWTYVATAVRSATTDAGPGALAVLASSSPASIQVALAVLLNEISALSTDLLLVLDDYHLIRAAEVHEGMRFLLEHQPDRLHLVLATRADPPLPVARMRARGQLLELRAGDLRCTPAESGRYLNGPMHLELVEQDVAALDARTEGWIAALQLAALSIQGRDDAHGFIAGFAGDDRHVLDYLVEEVLVRQPADVRDFLLATSVLERLTGPLCDAVTGRTDGGATLAALERANLFLVPLDDTRRWYRYHHLFAEVLRAHLREEQPARVAILHRAASAWFAAQGDDMPAIGHALAGEDPDRAAELLELAIPALGRARREAEFTRWAGALPDDVLRVRPVLAVALAGALAQQADFGTVAARLDDVDRALRPSGGPWPEQPPPGLIVIDPAGFRALPATVELYRSALALAHGDLDATAGHAQAALSLLPPGDADLVRAAAGALGGLAAWAVGDLASAEAAYGESVSGLAAVGFVSDVLGCCIALGDIQQTLGRLSAASQTYRWALDLGARPAGEPALRGAADMHVAMAGVLVERDDLTGAVEHLTAGERSGAHAGLPQNPYRSRVVRARIRAAEGDLDDALDLLEQAERVYDGDYSPDVRPVPSLRARLHLRRGELARAEAWVRDRHLAPDDELSYLREHEHLTLARVLLARYRADPDPVLIERALGLLARLLVAAVEGERTGSALEVLVVQALVLGAAGRTTAALDGLRRAVALAEPEGWVRLFADEGEPMAVLLTALVRQGVDPGGHVRRLFQATTGTGTTSGTARQPLVEPLSVRELDVLRMLGTDLDGPAIARALFVSLNTVRTHTRNVYAKLGVTSRRAAVRQAQQLGLLPGPQRT